MLILTCNYKLTSLIHNFLRALKFITQLKIVRCKTFLAKEVLLLHNYKKMQKNTKKMSK